MKEGAGTLIILLVAVKMVRPLWRTVTIPPELDRVTVHPSSSTPGSQTVRLNQGTTDATEAGKVATTCEDFIAAWVQSGHGQKSPGPEQEVRARFYRSV